jgi:hypothetical protein
MAKAKAKKTEKKKGPKGKKARAKAKLERQWGETAIVEDEKPRRVKNSRLLNRTNNSEEKNQTIRWAPDEKKPTSTAPEKFSKPGFSGVLKNKKSSYHSKKQRENSDFFSDSEEDSEDEETPVIQGLLSSIRKTKGKDASYKPKGSAREAGAQFDNEEEMGGEVLSDSEMGDSSESENSENSEDEGNMSDDDVEDKTDDKDDDSVSGHIGSSDDKRPLDLYHQRFSRDPLTKDELANTGAASSKVTVNDILEFQVTTSSPVNGLDGPTFDSNTTPDELKRLAESSFEINRTVLQRRWKQLNKSKMTEVQFPVYPFLSRYMDMFVETSSRKVCSEGM